MRLTAFLLGVLSLSLMLLAGAQAQDAKGKGKEAAGKEVTLKGKITCAKCDLATEKACKTVIVTKTDDKEVVLYFDPAGHKKFHSNICNESKPGSVTGTVKDEGKMKVITVKDVKFD
ncbi:MAG: hypothetical protein K2X38_10650 [Gemmataceae bacterium]|nr:hypothetical protein [Gemmataceae bacterium]